MQSAYRGRHECLSYARTLMRVVAGKYRSRALKSMRGLALRPSSDRLRETLFNILGAAVEGSVFVDVYADRKSTRLNSSHLVISYAVFCLKKKKKKKSIG